MVKGCRIKTQTRSFPEKLDDRTKESATVELVTPTDDRQSRKKYFGWTNRKGEKQGEKKGQKKEENKSTMKR